MIRAALAKSVLATVAASKGEIMSTFAYGALTATREDAPAGSTTGEGDRPIKTYLDSLAALVPAEVLVLHALAVDLTTESTDTGAGTSEVLVTDDAVLGSMIVVLPLVAVALYVMGRLRAVKKLERLDLVRALIPAVAFVGWTMIQQPPTAFDGAFDDFNDALRFLVPAIGAVLLGYVASSLAYRADGADGVAD